MRVKLETAHRPDCTAVQQVKAGHSRSSWWFRACLGDVVVFRAVDGTHRGAGYRWLRAVCMFADCPAEALVALSAIEDLAEAELAKT